MSLWLCLRFPLLPLQCQAKGETRAAVVIEQQRVVCHNDCAATLGIRQGASVATARALAGEDHLQLLERRPEQESLQLEQLCHWAYGMTPKLHVRPPDSLLLEIGGSLVLFHGLQPLLHLIDHELALRGWLFHAGLATTPGAAWLLSHAPGGLENPSGDLESRLAPLPLDLLTGDFPAAVNSLKRAGIDHLGAVLELPEAALARRCGQAFTDALRRILGREAEPLPDYRPPARFRDSRQFDYEIRANEELLPAMQQLLAALGRFLQQRQLATRAIDWQIDSPQGRALAFRVRSSSPHGDPARWMSLTRLQFERQQLRHPADRLTLLCEQLESPDSGSQDLFGQQDRREPLEHLLDRLSSRLGRQAVSRIGCRDEHLPELALYIGPRPPDPSPTAGEIPGPRPFWLLTSPQRLEHRQSALYWQGPLHLLDTAERLEDGWWLEPVCRDYHLARGKAGQYYWVFHDRRGGDWYLHGIFA